MTLHIYKIFVPFILATGLFLVLTKKRMATQTQTNIPKHIVFYIGENMTYDNILITSERKTYLHQQKSGITNQQPLVLGKNTNDVYQISDVINSNSKNLNMCNNSVILDYILDFFDKMF